jgi:hypothetical protein
MESWRWTRNAYEVGVADETLIEAPIDLAELAAGLHLGDDDKRPALRNRRAW